jgi:Lipid-droplet associated hydrolase
MASDEMRDISTDKWSDDIWGMPCGEVRAPKLVFYFGRNDHWVAERTREEIVSRRGKYGGPKMVVCEDSLPHAFSIRKFALPLNPLCFVLQDLWIRSLHVGD